MRTLIIVLFCCFSTLTIFAQEDFLAKQYFEEGEYEKAVVFYEKLVEKNPRRNNYVEGLVTSYQQLERYDDAEKVLLNKIATNGTSPIFLIELGYNYTLKEEPEKAEEYYQKAIQRIDTNPNFGYTIGFRFQKYALLDQAASSYLKAMKLKPSLNYDFQLARVYGEQGKIEKMYRSYLRLIQEGRSPRSNVLRNIDDFISEDPEDENNGILRRVLLQNAQKDPDVVWNELLSWLFVQQHQYSSAFSQEKAIYKRTEESSVQRLENLGEISFDNGDTEVAKAIFQYIVNKSSQKEDQLSAELRLIAITLLDPSTKELAVIEKKFEGLVEEFGIAPETLELQTAYAHFLTFRQERPTEGIDRLKTYLNTNLDRYSTAQVKLALGDILVYAKKFNEALIYYTQVQKSLKNDVLGQQARFKVAQASFYKGDFDWSLTQLKVLRGSTSQLIANDAMQLSLLISDNSLEDSTQTALKKYARADLLAYQQKPKEAIGILEEIIQNHKGEKIEDEALLRQGKLLVNNKEYDRAVFNYQKIIEFFGSDILADDAHFALGELYQQQLQDIDRAKSHYEKIIYNYQNSYYFPEARKKFRILRGDVLN